MTPEQRALADAVAAELKLAAAPGFEQHWARVFDLPDGGRLFYHLQLSKHLTRARFEVRQIEREDNHADVWVLKVRRGKVPVGREIEWTQKQVCPVHGEVAREDLLKAKLEGTGPVLVPRSDNGKVIGLLEALRQSVAQADSKPQPRPHPQARKNGHKRMALLLLILLIILAVHFPFFGGMLALFCLVALCDAVFRPAPASRRRVWKVLMWVFAIPFTLSLFAADSEAVPEAVLMFMALGCPVLALICACKAGIFKDGRKP